MNGPKDEGKREGNERKPYIIRKLCSGIEEYEAAPIERMALNLTSFGSRLEASGYDVVVHGPQLTILMDDIGVVAHIHPNGAMRLESCLREDIEKACDFIFAQATLENDLWRV